MNETKHTPSPRIEPTMTLYWPGYGNAYCREHLPPEGTWKRVTLRDEMNALGLFHFRCDVCGKGTGR